MEDLRIKFGEKLVAANDPIYTDTLNRLILVEHNIDGTHGVNLFNLTNSEIISDTEPSSTYPYMKWIDTSPLPSSPALEKIRTPDDLSWVVIATLNTDQYTINATSAETLNNQSPSWYMPTGAIIAFPMGTAPAGWMECDGRTILRETYADLFNVIGTTYNTGSELNTQFKIPDLRGEFIRGYDHGRGIDTARAVGSAQADAFKKHTHTYTKMSSSGVANGINMPMYQIENPNTQTGETGGTETRPRNIAMMYIIRY